MGRHALLEIWRDAHRGGMIDEQLVRQTATYICWHLIGVDYLPHTLVERRTQWRGDFSLEVMETDVGLT